MRLYLDTSAIISFFDQNSEFHANAKKLFQHPRLELYSGIIAVLELESVISRNLGLFITNSDQEGKNLFKTLNDSEKIQIIAQYCFNRLGITLVAPVSIEKLDFNHTLYDITNTNHLSLQLNRELKFRTLDAIQIASAVELRIYSKISIEYFVTNDINILQNKQGLYQKARILPISTDELYEILESPETNTERRA